MKKCIRKHWKEKKNFELGLKTGSNVSSEIVNFGCECCDIEGFGI